VKKLQTERAQARNGLIRAQDAIRVAIGVEKGGDLKAALRAFTVEQEIRVVVEKVVVPASDKGKGNTVIVPKIPTATASEDFQRVVAAVENASKKRQERSRAPSTSPTRMLPRIAKRPLTLPGKLKKAGIVDKEERKRLESRCGAMSGRPRGCRSCRSRPAMKPGSC
jgi:hypothetical protein